MNHEELAECRAARDRFLVGSPYQVLLADILSALLEHVDSQAAEIKQQAAYVARLEAEYLEAKEESLFSSHLADDILQCEKRAREALEKIRGGKG